MTATALNLLGRRAIETLPDYIRIAGFDINLEKWTHQQAAGANRYGEFSSLEQTIRVQIDMPSPYKAVDTVLHEICHAMFWAYGIVDDDKEERVVSALGSGWMAVHRDNPWLAKWLNEALHG